MNNKCLNVLCPFYHESIKLLFLESDPFRLKLWKEKKRERQNKEDDVFWNLKPPKGKSSDSWLKQKPFLIPIVLIVRLSFKHWRKKKDWGKKCKQLKSKYSFSFAAASMNEVRVESWSRTVERRYGKYQVNLSYHLIFRYRSIRHSQGSFFCWLTYIKQVRLTLRTFSST